MHLSIDSLNSSFNIGFIEMRNVFVEWRSRGQDIIVRSQDLNFIFLIIF